MTGLALNLIDDLLFVFEQEVIKCSLRECLAIKEVKSRNYIMIIFTQKISSYHNLKCGFYNLKKQLKKKL